MKKVFFCHFDNICFSVIDFLAYLHRHEVATFLPFPKGCMADAKSFHYIAFRNHLGIVAWK